MRFQYLLTVFLLACVVGCETVPSVGNEGEPCFENHTCTEGLVCNEDVCCRQNCDGKQCGDDGCGGSCGTCDIDESCVIGQCTCTDDCSSGERTCEGTGYKICGEYDSDKCLEWSEITSCVANEECIQGECECKNHWEGADCSTCPGNWDPAQDCDVCKGNWDPAQDCVFCKNHWEGADCGTCPGNWDPARDCVFCKNRWQGQDCTTCPGNWDPDQDCGSCLPGWEGSDCNQSYCDVNTCWSVPPTGQSLCYDESGQIACPGTAGAATCSSTQFCGQDAQYPDNERTFSVQTVSGNNIVIDSLTGLVWQQDFVTGKTWQEALDYCAGLNYAGESDWRLPDYHELVGIVDYGQDDPAIDTTAFPGTSGMFRASSSDVDPQYTGCAWGVIFANSGRVGSAPKTNDDSARCVRGATTMINEPGRFFVSGSSNEEIVTDEATGLVWQKEYVTGKNWQEALSYCEGLAYGNQADWRLPNVNELRSLVNVDRYNPASDFPGIFSDWFWTSSSSVGSTVHAWGVDFYSGYVGRYYEPSGSYARCVRAGP